MVGLPINFAIPGEGAVASYSYSDIVEGAGITSFAALALKNSTGITYSLTTNTARSMVRQEKGTGTGGLATYHLILDRDFDTLGFNTPRTMKGTAIIVLPYAIQSSLNTKPILAYYIVKIRKWDGSTETEITSVQSPTFSTSASATPGGSITSFSVAIPQTHFKKDEKLRITIEGWGKTDGDPTAAAVLYIAYDPYNRDSTTLDGGATGANFAPSTSPNDQTTKMEFLIPFRIDL